jgi:hypothetical protein
MSNTLFFAARSPAGAAGVGQSPWIPDFVFVLVAVLRH